MNKILIPLCITAALFVTFAGAAELSGDETFVSPDGRFAATGFIRILDRVFGKEYKIPVLPPISSLEWTKDSKTIVTVSHIAGGSYAVLLHFDGEEWQKIEFEPPAKLITSPYVDYVVLQAKAREHSVFVKYRIRTKMHALDGYKTITYSCTVDPVTRERTNERTE